MDWLTFKVGFLLWVFSVTNSQSQPQLLKLTSSVNSEKCDDKQLVLQLDECNQCHCFEGRLECSDLVCIRGSSCTEGQVVSRPDSCNACKCIEGHFLCTNYKCPAAANARNALGPDECQEGDVMPPPPPPNDCNTCYCMGNRILCTVRSCGNPDSEVNGRLGEQDERSDLNFYERQISVEPFINILYKDSNKVPAKLIHTHAYNGFHQEIKVRSSQLPKDTTDLLKVLAKSLDNAALASISQRLLTSSDSLSNNQNLNIPLDDQVVQNNLFDIGNVIKTQSGKVLTAGSQSNETILVIPNTKPFDGQDPQNQSVLPLQKKHVTLLKTLLSPATVVYNNNKQINPHSSQEKQLNICNDNPTLIIRPIVQIDNVGNPAKFTHSGRPYLLTKTAQNTGEMSYYVNTHSMNTDPGPFSKQINVNDGLINYEPVSQENKQLIPDPSGFVTNHNNFSHHTPYQITKPGPITIVNHTSSPPIFRPGQFISAPNNNEQTSNMSPPLIYSPQQNKRIANALGETSEELEESPHSIYEPNSITYPINNSNPPRNGVNPKDTHHKLIHSQFAPNPPNYYTNENRVQKNFEVKSNQQPFLPLSKTTITDVSEYDPMHPANTLQVGHLPNQNTNDLYKNVDKYYLPDQVSQELYLTISKLNHLLNKPNLQLDQHEPNPKLSYYHTASRDNSKTGVLNNFGSADGFQYPSYSADDHIQTKSHDHQPPLSQTGPTKNQYALGMSNDRDPNNKLQYPIYKLQNSPKSHFLPSHNQYTLGKIDDRVTAAVYYLSNSANPTHLQSNTHKRNSFGLTPKQHLPGKSDDHKCANGFQYLPNSAENPTHSRVKLQNQQLPYPPTQKPHVPGLFDYLGTTNGFQVPANSAENVIPSRGNLQNDNRFLPDDTNKNLPKQHYIQFGLTQTQPLSKMFNDGVSADDFQFPSHSMDNSTHPKDELHNTTQSQFLPYYNQLTPGFFDNRGSAVNFHYFSNSAEHPTFSEDNPPNPSLNPTHTPGVTDDRDSGDCFQHASNSDENSKHSEEYLNVLPLVLFDPIQNEHKENIHKLTNFTFHPTHSQHLSETFDKRGSADGFKPSDSMEDPIHSINSPDLTPEYSKALQNQPKFLSENSSNKFRPWVHDHGHDHDQYKPSSYDNLLNGFHNIPWLLPEDHTKAPIVSSTFTPMFEPDYGQHKPFDNLFNRIHQIHWPVPNQDIEALGSDTEITTSSSRFRPKYDQYGPSIVENLSQISDISDEDDDQQTEQDILTLSTYLLDSENNPDHRSLLPIEDGKLNKLIPSKYHATEAKQNIDMYKMLKSLSKLTPPKLKGTSSLRDINFSIFNPEIIEKILNDFKEDFVTTTHAPRTDSSLPSTENRFKDIPTVLDDIEQQEQIFQLKYPDIHMKLHQLKDEGDIGILPYKDINSAANLANDMGFGELGTSVLPKMFDFRFKHRPKDQKEECADGTQWISNCHGCSCYFSQAMCFKLPDCVLRPFGIPMTCKPYSHFKMDCYTCECNGDGVAECDSTGCTSEPNGKRKDSDTTKSSLPEFNEFFDIKHTDAFPKYKKLPKDCPKAGSQIKYPTCERGTSWISSCHKCECNEDGKHECVKIDNCKMDFGLYGKPSRCKPNSKFYPKTNSLPCVECSCSDEGHPYCPVID